MIRLRRTIERALEHRWLGPVIMVALVVMLVFVMLHTTIDAAHHEIGLACLAIVAVILRILACPRREVDRTRPVTMVRRRGPPIRYALLTSALAAQANAPPLRL